MDELLGLFRYHPKSGRALLNGTLLLRHCAARFACRTSTWRLPVSGHVVDLVTAAADIGREAVADGALQAVLWFGGSGPRRKRIRLNRKTPCTPRGDIGSFSSTCMEETASGGVFRSSYA